MLNTTVVLEMQYHMVYFCKV